MYGGEKKSDPEQPTNQKDLGMWMKSHKKYFCYKVRKTKLLVHAL